MKFLFVTKQTIDGSAWQEAVVRELPDRDFAVRVASGMSQPPGIVQYIFILTDAIYVDNTEIDLNFKKATWT